MAVLWADVSEFQVPINDTYPHPILAIRSNDGTYKDRNFAHNFAWAKTAMADGRLSGLIIYCVYRPNWEQTADTLMAMVGDPAHPQISVMIDVESWEGEITGDQSGSLNQMHAKFARWLGDPRRVIGYGNVGDLNALWPTKPPGVALVVADYGSVPSYPGMIAHQYADNIDCDPFGACDANSADHHDVVSLTAALGIAPVVQLRGSQNMERLPATAAPTDTNSDPGGWPQRNYDVAFDVAGGWEGDCAISFGGQDWSGRGVDDTRAFLAIASWMMDDGSLAPVTEGGQTPYVQGKGKPAAAHKKLGPWVAPHGAVGITLNYAAPGEGRVAVGRSA